METLLNTNYLDIKLFRSGKVRDVYEIEDMLLIVATDRISAFDVIMSQPIPDKGSILSKISSFWFENTRFIIPNHFITNNIDEYPQILKKYSSELENRSMLVRRCNPLPLECIVRGYVAGSGWKEYKRSQTICGIPLPDSLLEHSKLPEPIFTPSTKAEEGHDENISFEDAIDIVGSEIANQLRDVSIALYKFASEYLESVGLILADTKFEFGKIPDGGIILIDEALTPDSSRFWLKADYAPGKPIVQFDKQPLRDYLESIEWNKQPPPPILPKVIIESTTERYKEAAKLILKTN
jgi:phosphoribosylaminoimidazole-succinocarboxamide synthase